MLLAAHVKDPAAVGHRKGFMQVSPSDIGARSRKKASYALVGPGLAAAETLFL